MRRICLYMEGQGALGLVSHSVSACQPVRADHCLKLEIHLKKKLVRLKKPRLPRLHKQERVPLEGNPIPTAQWREGHTYIQFPRPKEYTLGGIGAPLDRISVKQLTIEFSKNRRTPPAAPKAWDNKMASINQPPPNWEIVADRYTTRFLTPKDSATHFKHITHRGIRGK